MRHRDELDEIIDGILAAEGWPDFVDHPADRGGPTKGGITLKTLTEYRMARDGAVPSVDDLKNLDEDEARRIYLERYIVEPGFHKIADPPLMLNVIDAGVLHGTGWAARRLQEVAEVTVDGDIGPETLGAVNDGPEGPLALNLRFTRRRIDKCIRIALHDRTQLQWLKGWINRAGRFLEIEADLLSDV